MGLYINPGNEYFSQIRSDMYVDKSGLISVVNSTIEKNNKLSCVSSPRRFGKSYAAAMLAAYYCTDCDSAPLFDDLEIARMPGYREHMNKYNVLYMDITGFIGEVGVAGVLESIRGRVYKDAEQDFSEVISKVGQGRVCDLIAEIAKSTGRKFIAIIDEWDAPIRDPASTPGLQKDYLEFLRSLFKNANVTARTFAAVYMTGILSIKKDGSQSAISEFREYSIIRPDMFAPYVGFTETEVEKLCRDANMDFSLMKRWYDGYLLPGMESVYNPNSVIQAVSRHRFDSYWSMSSSAGSLVNYINMDYEGLGDIAEKLIADQMIRVETNDFENDPSIIRSRDDVLTLLIYYGYLSYDSESGLARIPNEELKREFSRAVRKVTHPETMRRVAESDRLIQDAVNMRADEVAAAIEKVHREEFEPRHYNNEQSLRAVIKLAFFAYKDKYTQLEELAGGEGYADIVYLPKKAADMPILVIELKWNKAVRTALDQIKEKHYPDVLKDREETILLIGISYDKDDPVKKHHCEIEEL